MCILRARHEVHVQITEYQCHHTGKFENDFACISKGTILDVEIYDSTGMQVCYQYPDGSVAVGVPFAALTLVSACGGCIDPHIPQEGFGRPLGIAPRWTMGLD